ncbi:hypothetical protein [Micromonospora sp. NPDC047730]|uniref:hypothetical protein n=1 Tax=Micromonospora sp. NPDC047730 TaxID=3364253 RepID=UPI0037232DA7
MELDDELDPYRPDATVEERTDHVIGVLLSDDDPVRRYRTVQALQDGRLREAAAISLRQLRDQHGTTDAAAAAVGISRQAANELLAKAGAPGAREDRAVRDAPTYAYGTYLAAARACADNIPAGPRREKAIMRYHDLEAKAVQTLTVFPALAEAAQKWLSQVRPPSARENCARKLENAAARIADWVAGRTDPWLSIGEQSEVYIGYHSSRVRWREERRTTSV